MLDLDYWHWCHSVWSIGVIRGLFCSFEGSVLLVPIVWDLAPKLATWMFHEGCHIGLPGWHDWAVCISRATVGNLGIGQAALST